MDSHWTVTVLQACVILTVVALIFRAKLPPVLGWALAGVSMLAVSWLTLLSSAKGVDAKIFWNAGSQVWDGLNPYAAPEIMNPPTAFPFFAMFALLPFMAFTVLWKVLNLGGGLTLAALSGRLDDPRAGQSAMIVALLGCAVLLSFPYRYGVALGQLSLLTTAAVFVALWCQQRQRPVAAGVFLAIGSIKPAIMLPFLLLFCQRRDWKSWVSLTVAGFGLTFLTIPPTELPQRLADCLANIKRAGEPGRVNDYSFASSNNRELIALDYAFYHLGLRERGHVQAAQLLTVGLLGAWVAWQVLGSSRLSRAAAISLVTCYTTLFLYHRLYDMVLLAVPLVYVVGQARSEPGRVRWLYSACALALLGVLNVRLELLKSLTPYAMQPGFGPWLVEALLLPYGTWLMLAVVVGLSLAERWKTMEPAADVLMARAEIGERPGTARIDITRISAEQFQSH